MTFSIRASVALFCVSLAVGAGDTSAASATEAIGILNDSGQTQCYDATDHAVACDEASSGDDAPYPYQDGQYGRDAAATLGLLPKIGGGDAGFDFTRVCISGEDEGHGDCASPPPVPADVEHPEPNDWACLRDNNTGLIFTLGNSNYVTWDAASSTSEDSYIGRANASSRCGLSSGWRLPHRRESGSLTNLQRRLPSVDPAYFPILGGTGNLPTQARTQNSPIPADVPQGIAVWTADPAAWHGMFQYTTGYGNSATGSYQCRELAPPYPCDHYPGGVTAWTSGVLLVNGAWKQPNGTTEPDGERWQIQDDGLTVTDSATGLVWDRCSWGQGGADCLGDVTIFPNWTDAMQVARLANEQRYKGFRDWRLPNFRELDSLVKIDAANPAIDTEVFPNTLHADNHSYYWTSSSDEFLPGWAPAADCVEFVYGTTATSDKISTYAPGAYPYIGAVRLVRVGSGWTSFDGVSDRLFWSGFDGTAATAAASTH